MASSTNNFKFNSATFDYYLERSNTDGTIMHVKEVLEAEFPNYDQNHGIERYIPFTNKGGHNITVQNQSALNLSVSRNGSPEPFSLEKEDNYYNARIGSANSYVHGIQTYDLSYDFTRVITEYDNTNTQELYWDTNGTGWSQPFGEITANVHLPNDVKVLDTSCYVGRHGSSGQDRCTTTKTSDGYSFSTSNLAAKENLTFDLEFPANTFTVPAKPDSYILVFALAAELIIAAIISFLIYNFLWKKVRDNYRWYKNAPVPPQYTPLKGYTAAQLANVYLKKTEDPKTATLLELTIAKKISLIKGEKKKFSSKYHWSIKVNSLSDLSEEQLYLLKLFNGGHTPAEGVTYEVKKQSYSSALESAYNSYASSITTKLYQTEDFTKSESHKLTSKTILATVVIFAVCFALVPAALSYGIDFIEESLDVNYYNIIAPFLLPVVTILPIFFIILHIFIASKLSPYKKYTRKGLEHSNYVEGLKLYIKMAEADRLKFLQSVDGADTSNGGIVKLYEKLLPYAALFGLEKSWIDEMEHYYDADPKLTRPDWYDVGLAYALASNDFSSNFARPVDPSSTSSSGSSGGGGGGFSGGGGGGGGGGGW